MKTAFFKLVMWHRIAPTLVIVPAIAAAVIAASCVGYIGNAADSNDGGTPGSGGTPPTTMTESCTTPKPGSAPLRRLTQSEYNNTVRDLLGDNSQPANSFPPDQQVGAFTNTATALTVPPLLAQSYQSAAEQLASTAVTKHLSIVLGCDPATIGDDACAKSFIKTFGERAYRRPLSSDEQATLFSLYEGNKADADFNNGVQSVIEAVLQSASFLYRVEFGVVSQAKADVVPVAPYEMASRLSYFLWDSMPDENLMTAAAANKLGTASELTAQARRMLKDPKAHPAVEEFFKEWMTLNQLPGTAKDPVTYPEYTPTLQAGMVSETLAFIDWVMWESDARYPTLLTSPVSFVNQELAAVYGISGVTGTALKKVTLDTSERAGFLTQLSMMSLLGKPDRSSPVLRGRFVRQNLFCQTIAPPPADIVITPPTVMQGVTTREAFVMHDAKQPCKGCHVLMDPIGFGFENFDGVGKYRVTDEGQPVDSSGSLAGTDVDGPFNGAVGLADKLIQSQAVSDCMATEWFRYAFGRGETNDDECSLDAMKQTFGDSKMNFKELLVAVTQTDAFRYRPEVKP
jgi:hypothetical protein